MGNAKSKNSSHKIEKGISRNLVQPKVTALTAYRKDNFNAGGGGTITSTTTTTATAGGPLLVEVRDSIITATATTTTTKNTATETTTTTNNKALKDTQQIQLQLEQQQQQQEYQQNQRKQKAADNSAANAAAVAKQQYQQQRLKQASSLWNLGSLNWNLSFSGRNSYKQRQKSSRKSFSTLQSQRKRSKTQWHRPLTNAIFSSHFKESSRNEEFHIDQLVAKGAFGVVFKVIDKKINIKEHHKQQQQQQKHQQREDQPLIGNSLTATTSTSDNPVYALKVLKKSKIISENSLQQLKDEVEIQKLCGHHPFIVKQFDLWQNRYNLHILSEYIPNGELFSRIRSFSLNLIRLYLAEIALALDFLHNAGIIYRDAKPENILLTYNYHIKLTDFGLSKWLKLGLTTKTMCGTFQYMAPEILRGDPYTHAVDWWSLGIIVCQMFIKKSPDIRQFITINLPKHLQANDSVDNANNLELQLESSHKKPIEAITSDERRFLPSEVENLPHEAVDVLQRLLEFDDKKRIRSVRALQRIAMYKDFKIESQYCLKIRPLDIITEDNITIYESTMNSDNGDEVFKNF